MNKIYLRFIPAALAIILTWLPIDVIAATFYVDGSSTCSGTACNGTSWNSAWKAMTSIAGLNPGDTVYISGGSTSQTYAVSSWNPTAGVSGTPITYKVAQDAGHNGTVTFNCGGGLLNAATNTVISGDAGDGKQHIALTNCPNGLGATSNIRYSYIAVGTVGEMFNVSGSFSGIELDHLTARTTTTADHLAYWDNSSSCGAYGLNKVHDNTFALSNNGPGIGADGFQGNNSCTDFYNNYIYGVTDGYSGGQHQDGHQPLWGNYIRIWGSKYENISNYAIYFDGYIGGYSHVRIYNNTIALTSSAIQNGSPGGIVAGVDGGASNGYVFNDMIFANNTFSDFMNNQEIALNNMTSHSATFTNNYIQNNVGINSGVIETTGNNTVTLSNNVSLTSSVASSGNFVHYAPLDPTNNFHLLSTATSLIGKGTDLSSYFTTDKDNNTRTVPWDVGAYANLSTLSTISGTSGLNPPTSLTVAP